MFMRDTVESLFEAVQLQERRNRLVHIAIRSIFILLSLGLVFTIGHYYSWAILALTCAVLLGAAWRFHIWSWRTPRVSIEEASTLIDKALPTKDRSATLYGLRGATRPEDIARRDFIRQQLHSICDHGVDAKKIAPLVLSRRDREMLWGEFAIVVLSGLAIYLYSPPKTERLARDIRTILETHPELPTEVRQEALQLAETLKASPQDKLAVKEALEKTREALRGISKSSPSEHAINIAPSSETHESQESTTDSKKHQENLSPTPTPTPKSAQAITTPTKQPDYSHSSAKKEDQNTQQSSPPESKSSKQEESVNQSESSETDKSGSEQDDSQQETRSGNSQTTQQGKEREGEDSQGQGEENGKSEGSEPGSGGNGSSGSGNESDGDATGENNSGKHTEGSSQKGQNQDSTSSAGGSGEQALEGVMQQVESEMSQSQSGEPKGEQGSENHITSTKEKDTGSPNGKQKEQSKEGSQSPKPPTNSGDQSDKGESNGTADSSKQREDQKNTSGQVGGATGSDSQHERPQNERSEKQQSQGDDSPEPQDKTNYDQKTGHEKQDAQQASEQKNEKNPGSRDQKSSDQSGNQPSTGEDSPMTDRNAHAVEGAPDEVGDGGSGLGGKKGYKNITIEESGDQFDPRHTGEDSKLEETDEKSVPKTSLEDVTLAKPKGSKEKTEQPIPLEYRSVLQ